MIVMIRINVMIVMNVMICNDCECGDSNNFKSYKI